MLASPLLRPTLAVLASLALSACLADDTPIQHRIALLPDGMTVSWSTTGPMSGPPSVGFGLERTVLSSSAAGLTEHYDASVTWFHHVELHGLKANTTYYWTVLNASNKTVSPTLSFKTQPAMETAGDGAFSVAIYGDLGIDNSVDTVNLLRRMARQKAVDLFWHVGDLSYADDHSETTLSYEEIMEGWMHNMTGVWDESPYLFCPGNHENSGGRNALPSQKNFTSYRQRFHMPFQQSGSSSNMFSSWNYGLVHFINIDTESAFPGAPEGGAESGPFGDQAAWLKADLTKATANRGKVPWIVVGGHRPFWATDGYLQAQRAFFFPIFDQFDIDFIFVGHIHYYERLYALSSSGEVCSKDYVQPQCPIHIVTGAAGNIEGLSRTNKTEPYSARLLSDFGIGVLHVNGPQQLTWEFIESASGKVLDSITVHKTHTAGPQDEQPQQSEAAEEELEVQGEHKHQRGGR